MKAADVRQSFVDFFKEKQHVFVPSSPLIPQGDPTLLFVNAGMNQFKNIFLGLETPENRRAANYQKCLRVSGKHNDLEDVGMDTYHHTFFEMLGNWSFGDYYKKESIQWAWELLTERLKLPKEKLYATVYYTDEEALELWKEVTDIAPERILKFKEKDNFWEMGETGPCGPCSEIHIDLGEGSCDKQHVPGHQCGVNQDCARYIELWNLVFIQYNRKTDGSLEPLKEKHIDTGAGLERLVAVLQGKFSNYDTDLFQPVIKTLEEWTGKTYSGDDAVAMRVIADHIRTLCFAIADGIIPSNEGRGYVIRRILRRAFRYGKKIGLNDPFLYKLSHVVVKMMGDAYPELFAEEGKIEKLVQVEEEKFALTLDKGLELFEKVLGTVEGNVFPGEEAFTLYDTYGFPLDLTELLCREKGYILNHKGFDEKMQKQKEMARSAAKFQRQEEDIEWVVVKEGKTDFRGYEILETQSRVLKYEQKGKEIKIVLSETPFYAESGGQIGDTGVLTGKKSVIHIYDVGKTGEDIIHYGEVEGNFDPEEVFSAKVEKNRRDAIKKNHTATHLLHKALRMVLGEHVQQSGSLVDDEKLRFDFSHFEKVGASDLNKVEEIVNQEIQRATGLEIGYHTMDEAKEMGAMALFGEKYGDTVRVVQVPGFSLELCGGTHVHNTGEIGAFKITSESAVASGIRRIEAVTGMNALHILSEAYTVADELSKSMNVPVTELMEKIAALQKEMKKLKKSGAGKKDLSSVKIEAAEKMGNTAYYEKIIEGVGNPNELKKLNDDLKSREKDYIAVFIGKNEGKNSYVCAVGKETGKKINARDISRMLNDALNGKGGGREDMTQGTLENFDFETLKKIKEEIKAKIS
jgi:alanyl-tRNA synthetase